MGQHLIPAAGVFILPLEIRTLYVWHKPWSQNILPTTDLSNITSFLSHFIIYPSLPFFIPRHNERKRFCNRLKVSPLVPVYLPPFLPLRGQWRYNGDITPMNRDIIQWRAQPRLPGAAHGWLFIIVLASAGHFLYQKSDLEARSWVDRG